LQRFRLAKQYHGTLDFGPVAEDLPSGFGGLFFEQVFGVGTGALYVFPENCETFLHLGFEMEGDRLQELLIIQKKRDTGADFVFVLFVDVGCTDFNEKFFDECNGTGGFY